MGAVTDPLTIGITEAGRRPFEGQLTGPVELGRQQAGEPEPYAFGPADVTAAHTAQAAAATTNAARAATRRRRRPGRGGRRP